MKTLIIVLTTVLLTITPVFAYHEAETTPEKEEQPMPMCPATKMADKNSCMNCHAMLRNPDGKPYFGLKELEPDANYTEKPHVLDIIMENDQLVGYVEINGTNSTSVKRAAQYLFWHPEIKKCIIAIHSGGGSVMDGWKTVGHIMQMQQYGIVVETRVLGISASAAVFIMVAGDIGHRYVNPHAELMIHKVMTFSMFDMKTPDSSHDQTETLKHFQANINEWIVSRSKMTLKQLEECMFKRDYWFNGKKAVEFGLADHFVGVK